MKTRAVLLVCFVLAFAAGGAAGLLAGRAEMPCPPPPDRDGWLATKLALTPEQREEMRKIWSDVMEASGKQQWEQRKAFADERDRAIAALLTPGQKPTYDLIQQDYSRKVSELGDQRRKAWEQAVELTKQMLTPSQAAQYDELMKRQRDRGPGGPAGPGGPPWGHGRHRSGPFTAPSSSEPASRGAD